MQILHITQSIHANQQVLKLELNTSGHLKHNYLIEYAYFVKCYLGPVYMEVGVPR